MSKMCCINQPCGIITAVIGIIFITLGSLMKVIFQDAVDNDPQLMEDSKLVRQVMTGVFIGLGCVLLCGGLATWRIARRNCRRNTQNLS